jgi:hypothetical protein
MLAVTLATNLLGLFTWRAVPAAGSLMAAGWVSQSQTWQASQYAVHSNSMCGSPLVLGDINYE